MLTETFNMRDLSQSSRGSRWIDFILILANREPKKEIDKPRAELTWPIESWLGKFCCYAPSKVKHTWLNGRLKLHAHQPSHTALKSLYQIQNETLAHSSDCKLSVLCTIAQFIFLNRWRRLQCVSY